MKTYKFVVETGYVGAEHEEVFEFEDDVTEKELDKCLNDYIHECVEGYYKEIGDDNYD